MIKQLTPPLLSRKGGESYAKSQDKAERKNLE
uniref:Uncharacterized protein n=1 Tax=Siphoviridae sp. ctHjK2 TaxID=2827831 RepID=A0A8S5SQJ1_9CAUD|nr:MAG TPA: hypothetical protein [Siphoviridae sp. ctHjK2]